ncbi:hypothetical protein VP01_891g7 [Puccinia sorghi]|uniref:Uncharacterized protein n=1 Tax=Puccinia sorghi TaxID=27349 RepID=A0A0L6U819_9BASI|nr:hypothetical protein VP01_891g7 [Puccinia sorghi]
MTSYLHSTWFDSATESFILMPGFLGTEKYFNERFRQPISASSKVLPFLLKTLKEDVLDNLPPKIIQEYYWELLSIEKSLYKDFSNSQSKNDAKGLIKNSTPNKTSTQHMKQMLDIIEHNPFKFQMPNVTYIHPRLRISAGLHTDCVEAIKFAAVVANPILASLAHSSPLTPIPPQPPLPHKNLTPQTPVPKVKLAVVAQAIRAAAVSRKLGSKLQKARKPRGFLPSPNGKKTLNSFLITSLTVSSTMLNLIIKYTVCHHPPLAFLLLGLVGYLCTT